MTKGLKNVSESFWVIATRSRKPSLTSHLVMKIMGTNFSHTAVMYYSKDTRGFVVSHADQGTVKFENFRAFESHNEIIRSFQLRMGVNDRRNAIKTMVRFSGTEYSMTGVLGILLAKIFDYDWNVFKVRDNTGAVICSEYIDCVLASIGLPTTAEALKIPRDLVTPADNVQHLNRLASSSLAVSEIYI